MGGPHLGHGWGKGWGFGCRRGCKLTLQLGCVWSAPQGHPAAVSVGLPGLRLRKLNFMSCSPRCAKRALLPAYRRRTHGHGATPRQPPTKPTPDQAETLSTHPARVPFAPAAHYWAGQGAADLALVVMGGAEGPQFEVQRVRGLLEDAEREFKLSKYALAGGSVLG